MESKEILYTPLRSRKKKKKEKTGKEGLARLSMQSSAQNAWLETLPAQINMAEQVAEPPSLCPSRRSTYFCDEERLLIRRDPLPK